VVAGVRGNEGEVGETVLCSTRCRDKAGTTWGWWLPTAGAYRRVTTHGVTRACTGDRRKPFKWQLWLTSGPWPLFDFSTFSNTQTLKSKMVTFQMSKFLQILQVDCLKHKKQLCSLDRLQNRKGLHVINFGINSNLNLPGILKGYKPFYKNLINSLKFYPHMICLNINLH
jgi:hypothetical protein